MAVVNRNSTAIANLVASPRVINNPAHAAADLQEIVGLITSAADDTNASIGRFFRIPSNARVSNMLYSGADATTAGNIDLGLYDTADNGGAVVDADFFASAFALTNGPDSNTELAYESGVYTLTLSGLMLWQALGLSADPVKEYDVAYTITTTFNGGPTLMKLTGRFVQ